MTSLAESAGQLLRKAQLFQQLLNEQRKTRALIQVLQADEQLDHVDAYLHRILTIAHEVMPCERVALFFIDPVREDLYSVSLSYNSAHTAEPCEYNDTKRAGIPYWVAAHGVLANVSDAQLDPRNDNSFDAALNMTTTSCLCLPVVQSNGSVLAVFMSINKSRSDNLVAVYDDEDEDILQAWTLQVGSTMRRRLTEIAIARTRRELNDDSQIISLMQLYGTKRSSILEADANEQSNEPQYSTTISPYQDSSSTEITLTGASAPSTPLSDPSNSSQSPLLITGGFSRRSNVYFIVTGKSARFSADSSHHASSIQLQHNAALRPLHAQSNDVTADVTDINGAAGVSIRSVRGNITQPSTGRITITIAVTATTARQRPQRYNKSSRTAAV